jgi:hypothetical protein
MKSSWSIPKSPSFPNPNRLFDNACQVNHAQVFPEASPPLSASV